MNKSKMVKLITEKLIKAIVKGTCTSSISCYASPILLSMVMMNVNIEHLY